MSVTEQDRPLIEVATALLDAPVDCVERLGGGRNSRVYRVQTPVAIYALKQYPSREDDPRDRLGTEVAALRWMNENHVSTVPRVVAIDRDRNFTLLSWMDGELVRDVGAADVEQAAVFLKELHGLRHRPALPKSQLAAEACLSAAEIERQLRIRVAQLEAIADEPALAAFLASRFKPALQAHLAAARKRLAMAGIAHDEDLVQDRRSLVPSDFGFHNALRRHDGRLGFIDFEYFGWDDPVKLTADILLHPGTSVSEPLLALFRRRAEEIYGEDATFAARLDALYPLFGLRWVLILLNEFHAERWRRRVLAGASEDWAVAKTRQLRTAEAMLSRLST